MSKDDYEPFVGLEITNVSFDNERLMLFFGEESLKVYDDGQCCCESRYMTTDDNPKDLIGGRLLRIEAKDGPIEDTEDGFHETCFVEIATDKGFITLTNHNEHNGYYGGFYIRIQHVS